MRKRPGRHLDLKPKGEVQRLVRLSRSGAALPLPNAKEIRLTKPTNQNEAKMKMKTCEDFLFNVDRQLSEFRAASEQMSGQKMSEQEFHAMRAVTLLLAATIGYDVYVEGGRAAASPGERND